MLIALAIPDVVQRRGRVAPGAGVAGCGPGLQVGHQVHLARYRHPGTAANFVPGSPEPCSGERGGFLDCCPQCVICTRMGVGLKLLQGLLTCGQFEMTASASMSARSATWQPGGEMPGAMAAPPSPPTGTRMNQLMFGTMSRRPSPWRASAVREFSRQPGQLATPYTICFDGTLQQPP